jgi:GT2 family glycosyltransferase
MRPPLPDSSYDVSIVIPTHNRAPLLSRTLSSLASIDVPAGTRVELIVVASACTDGTIDAVSDARKRFPYDIRAVEELKPGVSRARNRCLAEARAPLIAFIDDDVWVEREWLTALLHAADQLPAAILVGRVTLEWESFRPLWTSPAVETLWGANGAPTDVCELASASLVRGANFAVRRSVADKVGGFFERLGRFGGALLSGEETDFARRALDAGNRLFFVPDMAVRHWIPQERATREYLKGVAVGRGRSRVALQQSGCGRSASACIRVGAGQAIIGAGRVIGGWLRRDDTATVAATLLWHRGMATLGAFVQAQFRKTDMAGN